MLHRLIVYVNMQAHDNLLIQLSIDDLLACMHARVCMGL